MLSIDTTTFFWTVLVIFCFLYVDLENLIREDRSQNVSIATSTSDASNSYSGTDDILVLFAIAQCKLQDLIRLNDSLHMNHLHILLNWVFLTVPYSSIFVVSVWLKLVCICVCAFVASNNVWQSARERENTAFPLDGQSFRHPVSGGVSSSSSGVANYDHSAGDPRYGYDSSSIDETHSAYPNMKEPYRVCKTLMSLSRD